jgi:hypothetical protein
LQIRRSGVQHRLGRRKGDADALPIFAGLLHHRRQVLHRHLVLDRLAGAELVLRPPRRRADQVVQLHPTGGVVHLVHHDHRIALDLARPRGEVAEFALLEHQRFGVRLELLLQGDNQLGFLEPAVHEVLGQGDGGVGVELALLGGVNGAGAGEVLQLGEQRLVALDGLHLRLELASFALELVDLLFDLAHLLAGVFLDRPGAEARGQHADTLARLGVERAGDGRLGQRADDQLAQAGAGRHFDFARHQGAVGIDGDVGDLAAGDLRSVAAVLRHARRANGDARAAKDDHGQHAHGHRQAAGQQDYSLLHRSLP